MSIDKRHNYVLMLDTETANTQNIIIPAETNAEGNEIKPQRIRPDMSSVLIYDCGWAVVDTHGGLYETASFVNKDIFVHEKDLMQSAYYASKIPQYEEDLRAGRRVMANSYQIRQKMLETLDRYNIGAVAAHNARFDHNALNLLSRWITKSKYRYWFPFGKVEIWDTMRMANDVICKMPTYKEFCIKHGYVTDKGVPRKTAEILYRFITKNLDFKESHTGLEDVLIEAEIMWYCFRQHKEMKKYLYEPREFPEATDFQIALLASLKNNPTIRMGRA